LTIDNVEFFNTSSQTFKSAHQQIKASTHQ